MRRSGSRFHAAKGLEALLSENARRLHDCEEGGAVALRSGPGWFGGCFDGLPAFRQPRAPLDLPPPGEKLGDDAGGLALRIAEQDDVNGREVPVVRRRPNAPAEAHRQ